MFYFPPLQVNIIWSEMAGDSTKNKGEVDLDWFLVESWFLKPNNAFTFYKQKLAVDNDHFGRPATFQTKVLLYVYAYYGTSFVQ